MASKKIVPLPSSRYNEISALVLTRMVAVQDEVWFESLAGMSHPKDMREFAKEYGVRCASFGSGS
jgi:hypothetical protein